MVVVLAATTTTVVVVELANWFFFTCVPRPWSPCCRHHEGCEQRVGASSDCKFRGCNLFLVVLLDAVYYNSPGLETWFVTEARRKYLLLTGVHLTEKNTHCGGEGGGYYAAAARNYFFVIFYLFNRPRRAGLSGWKPYAE